MSKTENMLLALVYLLVQDARRKGAYGDLYLGSTKLPDFQSLESTAKTGDTS